MSPSDEQIELSPAQPDAVVDAVAELLDDPGPAADPWWQAGLDDALDT